MKCTPLYDQHSQAGASLIDFYGWWLPMHYGSQIDEHHAVRADVGMFDVSHMAIVEIVGQDVTSFLRYLLANDVAKLKQVGRAQYTLMLNESGGFLDDLIVFFCDHDRYRLIFNAANAQRNIDWVCEQGQSYDVSVRHLSHYANIAIQGPKSWDVIHQVMPDTYSALVDLKPFRFIETQGWLLSRTGYTGEDGFEIMLPNDAASDFWQQLLDVGVQPCGLGARDTLRLEAGLNLYGQDMDESTLPIEANLDWVVAWKDDQRDFMGRQALEHKQPQTDKRLQGVVLTERGVLRSGQQVVENGSIIGNVTSGTFSPTMQCGVGLVLVDKPKALEDKLAVQYRRRTLQGRVVKPPFVRQGEILV